MEESRNRLTPRGLEQAELLLSLAARCQHEEPTAGPNRELDTAIGRAIGWRSHPLLEGFLIAPSWTTSLDAAVTLVPEGHDWAVMMVTGELRAECGPKGTLMAFVTGGKTAPLALCAAILEARAAIAGQEQPSTKRGEANLNPTLSKAGA
jgi:hypothetical protein